MQIDRTIAIIIIFFVILLIVFFWVMPEYNIFKQLRADLGQKQAEYYAQYDYYAAVEKSYSELKEREDDIKKVNDSLPEDPTFGKIIYFLQETAKESGLIVKNLSLSKLTPVGGADLSEKVKNIIFSMNLTGSHSSLENFIISLEKTSRVFEVISISFGSDSGSLLKNFNLQIKTYSY